MTATLLKEATPPAPARPDGARGRRLRRRGRIVALLFALPALLMLGALVVYPVLFSVGRSFFDASGTEFVGGENYAEMFRDPATLTAVRNTAIWVVVAPTLLTGLGLILAVLVEKVRWATAFKLLLFMPMAVSFLAAGIIFRLAYDEDPDKGVLNAAVVSVHDAFTGSSSYPTARARDGEGLTRERDGSYVTAADVSPGSTAVLGLVGVAPKDLPGEAEPASKAASDTAAADEVRGVVYLDFTPGGGGEPGVVDREESGLPGVTVEAMRDGKKAASTTTASDGSFRFTGLDDGSYALKLPSDNFAPPYEGISWLGPALVTPAIIGAYLWIWTGFAMVLIGAGLA
ncbi:carboxypeptidase regulatory-like domain-containing protein, partial [Streptomyces albogriseolus]|uniref:ABC transporter permease n=1 Tax=Streptomyces albogriseolus TaxID=1887 RepID=UPI0037ADAF7C